MNQDSEALRTQITQLQETVANFRTNTTSGLARLGTLQNDGASQKRFFEIVPLQRTDITLKRPPCRISFRRETFVRQQENFEAAMNQQALAKHLVRIQPVSTFVLSRFDSWIGGLRMGSKSPSKRTIFHRCISKEKRDRQNSRRDGPNSKVRSEVRLELIQGDDLRGKDFLFDSRCSFSRRPHAFWAIWYGRFPLLRANTT